MKEFDLVVIGGGPGGYTAAIRAAQKGATVGLVEKDRVGGTCLNRGCIPTKALYYSAKNLLATEKAEKFGIKISGVEFNIAEAVRRKNDVVAKLVGGIEQLLKANRIELIRGNGSIEAEGKVKVEKEDGSTEVVGAKSIIIATGSEPALIPAFKIDGTNVITSTEALELNRVPESLLIIGGGVMGCEFANIFSAFGSSVKIVEILPRILSTEDPQAVRVVERAFKKRGVEVFTGIGVEEINIVEDGRVETRLTDGRTITTEKVLVTIGRSFNSSGIGLESVGVKTDDKGRIEVDSRMQTTAKGVYAIGDVTGGMLLAHVAAKEGLVAVENALGGTEEMDYSVIPAGIFTEPEIASVGMREKEAKEKELEVKVGRFPYAASGKALTMEEPDGFVQIVADASTDKVLGATIVGAHATDLIGEVAIAIRQGAKVTDIADTVHAHPTLPELVMEAAEDVHGMAIHKAGRRK
ncbi:MAG TPA: dihydrolipoyl dehydrogenase [Deltaproteobacteria bacterium]|nr:dihydrolipoyl dehydrogenase [Deltaproteobacteria bacterium]